MQITSLVSRQYQLSADGLVRFLSDAIEQTQVLGLGQGRTDLLRGHEMRWVTAWSAD